jgi:hypothetical protein
MKRLALTLDKQLAPTLALLAIAICSCGKPDYENNPYAGVPGFSDPGGTDTPITHSEKNFATLVNSYAEGRADPTPWAGYWWPYKENGIAAGKYGTGGSPAGKYDAARGNKTKAQQWEVRNHGSAVPKLQSWWGHCNGWTAASSLFVEPTDPITVNGITFSVADQKALLSEASMEASADFFGNRVDVQSDYNTPKYTDTVPDQYFLVLTNYMGHLKHAVLIDRYTGDQIWNQPMAGYRIEYPKTDDYLGADPSAPGVYRILVTSKIWWMNDGVDPGIHTEPFTFQDTDDNVIQSRTLRSEIWLDGPVVFGADGRVTSSGDVVVTRDPKNADYFVGGAWKMGDGIQVDAWPDYMWVAYSAQKATDYGNPEVDVDWVRAHLLVPGGYSDPGAVAAPVAPPPGVQPPMPTGMPSDWPHPRPTFTFDPHPTPTGMPNPVVTPGPTMTPEPMPTHTHHHPG